MRIDPPRDQPVRTTDGGDHRHVEETARATSAIEKSADKEGGGGGGGGHRPFHEFLDREVPSHDSSVALGDPDRDEWTQEVIGARIHWQYGPDGKRKPFFKHQTRRLDDLDDNR